MSDDFGLSNGLSLEGTLTLSRCGLYWVVIPNKSQENVWEFVRTPHGFYRSNSMAVIDLCGCKGALVSNPGDYTHNTHTCNSSSHKTPVFHSALYVPESV